MKNKPKPTEEKKRKWSWVLYLIIILFFIIGIAMGFFVRSAGGTQSTHLPITVRESSSKYKFINPSLFTEIDKSAYPELKPLEQLLNTDIVLAERANEVDGISIYFRDLNSGAWTGVNEDEKYDPGSMLKVAVLIGYLRSAEADPSIMQKKLHYVATVDPGQNYKPEHPLSTGDYTVDILLNAMIVDSDNLATQLLVNNDPTGYVNVYKDFQLPTSPQDSNVSDFMSPKEYSVLFRSLYNSSYLSRSLSEQVLSLLSDTNFKQGLVAGVPTGTVVAHKFGEFTEVLNGNVQVRELHDCGIVYYPGHPYLLCVMTKGLDFTHLETAISQISTLIYDQVSTGKIPSLN